MQLTFSDQWTTENLSGGAKIIYRGNADAARAIGNTKGDTKAVSDILSCLKCYSCGIYSDGDLTIAWCDHVRAWPLFYRGQEVSDRALSLYDPSESFLHDKASAIELVTSGYITGKHTLHSDIKAIQPGEVIVFRNGECTPVKWYRYIPKPYDRLSQEEGIKALGDCLDIIFRDVITRAKGRPIWIPLSGGLDSRIILCKLHELGYKNLNTFSYGPRFNFEAFYAQKIAKKLNIPWQFVSITGSHARRMFESDQRKSFWRNVQNLKATPSMREYTAIRILHDKSIIPRDAILINGQSGDYITGNHISAEVAKSNDPHKLYETIIKKHYALFPELLTKENKDVIIDRIKEIVPAEHLEKGWIAEEIWEYEARQVTLVINGQRIYDELGYDWELPLWEKSLVDLCETLPLSLKFGQKLYKDYLRTYNYHEMFPSEEPSILRWPIPMLWVLPVAQVIGFVCGKEAKTRFYNSMKYFGHYSNQWAFFPYALYKKNAQKIRNVFSFYVLQWIKENRSFVPTGLAPEWRE